MFISLLSNVLHSIYDQYKLTVFHSTVSHSKKGILLSVALFTCLPFHTFLISHCSTVPVFLCQLLAVLSHCARSRSISLFTISWPVYHPLSGKSVAGRALASALFFRFQNAASISKFFFLYCVALSLEKSWQSKTKQSEGKGKN